MILKSITAVWTLVILFLSLYPFSNTNTEIKFWEHSDKLVHFSMYFILAFLVFTSLKPDTLRSKPTFWVVVVLVFYGIVIEAVQELMGLGRHFEILDITANSAGVLLGLTGYFLMKKCNPKLTHRNKL